MATDKKKVLENIRALRRSASISSKTRNARHSWLTQFHTKGVFRSGDRLINKIFEYLETKHNGRDNVQ